MRRRESALVGFPEAAGGKGGKTADVLRVSTGAGRTGAAGADPASAASWGESHPTTFAGDLTLSHPSLCSTTVNTSLPYTIVTARLVSFGWECNFAHGRVSTNRSSAPCAQAKVTARLRATNTSTIRCTLKIAMRRGHRGWMPIGEIAEAMGRLYLAGITNRANMQEPNMQELGREIHSEAPPAF